MNRKVLFDRLRAKPFGGVLTQGQVDGINTILDVWERSYRQRTGIAQLGYCCGTGFHETARTMQPIKEYGNSAYFLRMYDRTGDRPHVAATLGNTELGDGAKFPGRGLVQLTGRDNHRRATARLRELGIIGADIDFEANPDLVMRADLACHIMFIGMEEGWFTGAKLDTIIDENIDGDEHADFLAARKIINGTDRAEMIADYADSFVVALLAADTAKSEVEVLSKLPAAPDILQQVMALVLPMLLQSITKAQSGSIGAQPPQIDIAAILAALLGGKPVGTLPPPVPAPQPAPASEPVKPKTPWLERPTVVAGLSTFVAGVVAQLNGSIPPPAGETSSLMGILTTVAPLALTFLGGPAGRMVSNLFKGVTLTRKPS